MELLQFIFLLGINIVIFEFIWGVLNIFASILIGTIKLKYPQIDYVLRIIKYFLLVSVTARFVFVTSENQTLIHSENVKIILSSIVLGLYLIGKLQKREMFARFTMVNNSVLKGFVTYFDAKIERILVIGAMLLFIFCLIYPEFVNRPVINWFVSSIIDLSTTFFFGFIFKVIAFFFIINIFNRGAMIIGLLLQGKSLNSNKAKSPYNSPSNPFSTNQNTSNTPLTDDEGFSEYEEIDEEDE
ncbi:MAG TPA: hypothetical protein EYG85_07095 [Crocinitomix sp.]|nr:hypothetical protein [Crocinitomix sp.]